VNDVPFALSYAGIATGDYILGTHAEEIARLAYPVHFPATSAFKPASGQAATRIPNASIQPFIGLQRLAGWESSPWANSQKEQQKSNGIRFPR